MSRGQSLYVLVWPGSQPSDHILREEDAECTDPGCKSAGVVMDDVYDEPWCRRHADQFPAGERPSGPEIVRIDSARHKEVTRIHGHPASEPSHGVEGEVEPHE